MQTVMTEIVFCEVAGLCKQWLMQVLSMYSSFPDMNSAVANACYNVKGRLTAPVSLRAASGLTWSVNRRPFPSGPIGSTLQAMIPGVTLYMQSSCLAYDLSVS